MSLKTYKKYYIFGYLNLYYTNLIFAYDPSKESYQEFKFRFFLDHYGFKQIRLNVSWIVPVLVLLESIIGSLLVLFRFAYLTAKMPFVKKERYTGLNFIASLSMISFRVKDMLKAVRPSEVCTLKIPFTLCNYKENEIDILSSLRFSDIFSSFVGSLSVIWTIYLKYGRRDFLFRSYSSFEYLLTCCFVKNTTDNNRYFYYNTYDRWAFLMCNTKESTFIQHGKLNDDLKLIKVGTPHIAYYLNSSQKDVLDRVLFKSSVENVLYRPCLECTKDSFLKHNGKKNVLLVCWSMNIDKEWFMCKMLHEDVNLYIKPHPADKENVEYQKMVDELGCVIVPKTSYPKVDIVISYDSTLADEYDNIGVKVIRYDKLKDLNDIKSII